MGLETQGYETLYKTGLPFKINKKGLDDDNSDESERLSLTHSYSHAFKGFTAMLTEKEASVLSAKLISQNRSQRRIWPELPVSTIQASGKFRQDGEEFAWKDPISRNQAVIGNCMVKSLFGFIWMVAMFGSDFSSLG
ncbi:hypothetical protein GIB67_024726 [Kingdonia uniflora]|uniref:Inhibitor I9 domain-containing protein n=1 Tax=Kingdonia uniflora TaxID=39325 RepID=A0A7J7N9G2_9MAGN|nr:hypothetical protein GIB67_024726 [Kingdonia uniflora]